MAAGAFKSTSLRLWRLGVLRGPVGSGGSFARAALEGEECEIFDAPDMAEGADAAVMTRSIPMEKMLKDAGGVPAYGNRRSEWDRMAHPDHLNPEYR